MRHTFAILTGVALAFAPAASMSQEAAIYSGMDRIHPAWAKNGMVVAQEEVAAEIGRDILAAGGNAADAGVAVAFALAVTLPRAGNLGGGGFMMIHDAETGETKAIDYREMAPQSADRDMFLDEEGNADSQKSRFTGLATGVPGTVAGMQMVLDEYGTMTMAEVIEPAIRLARDGITVTADLADSLIGLEDRLKAWPSSQAIFYKEDGSFYAPGDTLVQSDLAATLQSISDQGPDGFYTGETAQAIVDAVQAAGGRITMEDMAGYKALSREPVSGTYRGYEIVSMPPPSSGGIHIIQILNTLEEYPIGFLGHNSSETIHLMAEAMKRAYADRSEYLGDPDFYDVPQAELTSKDYARDIRDDISLARATPSDQIKPADLTPYESDQTTHYSIVDKDGNAVSNTYTINFSYGSGMVADGTGVLMNNEMDDFAAKPGVMNAYGLIGGDANAVEPGKRPLSSMSPTLVTKDGKVFMVTGSPGGSRIITTVLQMIMNVIDHGMNVAEATVAPRIHHQWLPEVLRVEEGLSRDTIAALEAKGHVVEVMSTMGSAQSIVVDEEDGLLLGGADTRQTSSAARGY
ncbi:gamma-glutamyltransferase [Aliiroseovarius sediminis]|uniref:gamma-glutamyltransferase n=1 Tax=Aliiroseovarius sediminis TaxID=2925839 RepID=UPI001F568981|nr:gamma-glutamyltransferase [Aliiroseovarius sediminis]MCI2395333.1 gamma-glutamyltransferase [Aliiroseovarius sediminis]